MKRVATYVVAVALGLGLLAGTALAGGNEWPEGMDPHGHVMLIGAEIVDGFVHFDRCVEFAAGKPLPGPAHHNSVHTGAAGGSPFVQGALFHAGNWVIPLEPFGIGTGCESFTSPFPIPG
jgi:hypothetical protein